MIELGRDVEHCTLTGRIEPAGVRVRAALQLRSESALARALAQTQAADAATLDRLPEGLMFYGMLRAELGLEPFLRRYHQVIRQAQGRLPAKSAQLERLLADTASKLLDSQLQRLIWAFDLRFRGVVILEAQKPEVARQALLPCLEALLRDLAQAAPKNTVQFQLQANAGKILDRDASRIDLEIEWGRLAGVHGHASDAEEAFLRHLFGTQWTLWVLADERGVFLISARDRNEAERWLKNYRDGVVSADNATLRSHRRPLGDSLHGLAVLQFNGFWRHVLEGVEKAAAMQGLGNLIPRDAFPETKPAFFSLGVRALSNGLELELWAPNESVSELNRLFILVVHGLF
ncbi:hypothetical protein HRbin36_01199 [bacterium HR36]|nr:hypothetical protein HRbin36_01199 [bacterium HR36]